VIFSYAEEVFSAAGYHVSDILLNIVITGAVNLAFTPRGHRLGGQIGAPQINAFRLGGFWRLIYGFARILVFYRHSRGMHMLLLVVL